MYMDDQSNRPESGSSQVAISSPAEAGGAAGRITATQIEEACPVELADWGRRVAAHLKKAEDYGQKAEQHLTSAGQYLALAHDACTESGFDKFREKFIPNVGRSRAYELKAIATGQKSLEEIRAAGRERVARHRAKKAAGESVTPSNVTDSEGDITKTATPAEPDEPRQENLAGNSTTEDAHNVGDGDDWHDDAGDGDGDDQHDDNRAGDGDDRHDDNHAGDGDDRPATKPRTRRSSEQIQKDRAGDAASFICTTILAALDAGLSDALVDCPLTKHTDDLVEIARHPKFNTIFNAVVAGVMAKLGGGNEPVPDRESKIRLIGLQSENEDLRARIAELEAARPVLMSAK
jgi:hypothetical protein